MMIVFSAKTNISVCIIFYKNECKDLSIPYFQKHDAR